tara:strand:- start:234 stop:914 length:681 start_codon:yes stop_codon:yes gene_type:complete
MARIYIDNDAEWWRDAVQKICIIAECVDVYWDSKSFSPRLKDSKKRGAEAKKEFKKHFCMMKDMGIKSEHIDAFVDIVRIWRRIFSGKDRSYDPKWIEVLWGKYLRVPPNHEDEIKEIMINNFASTPLQTPIRVKCESEVEPPTPYKLNFGDDLEECSVKVEVSDVEVDDITSTYCGHYIDLGGNQVVADKKPDPTKIEAIIMLVKTLELNKADKVQLIQSVLSLI